MAKAIFKKDARFVWVRLTPRGQKPVVKVFMAVAPDSPRLYGDQELTVDAVGYVRPRASTSEVLCGYALHKSDIPKAAKRAKKGTKV